MRYAKKLGPMFAAVVALSAIAIGAASAAEGELLGATSTYTTADFGSATFEDSSGSFEVKCSSSKGEYLGTSATTGNFTEHFKGCTDAGIKCTGLHVGEATGEITMSGTAEVLAFKNGSTLAFGVVDTVNNFHFECLGVLTEVRGSVIGTITNANGEKTKEIKSSFEGILGTEFPTSINGSTHFLESETGGSSYRETSLLRKVTATGSELEVMY